MRISSQQMALNFLSDLQRNNTLIAKVSREVSSGKAILSPSDDPAGTTIAMTLRRDRAATDAWRATINDSLAWLNTTDRALGQGLDVVQRARELAVQGGNGTLSDSARALIADEVRSLASQFVEVGNSSLAGRFIFGGTATETQPFDPATETANLPINTGLINREVARGNVVSVNITADRFQGPGGPTPDVFTTLDALATALDNGDFAGLDTALVSLQAHQDNISALRGEGASKINGLEATLTRFDARDIATQQQLSLTEDVDMAAAITELKMREAVLTATMAVGARVIQPSLVDFIS
ncbi:MAG: flagellar hook-associated protein FlgL [Miltoncostaeaceae bacterium]